MTVKRVVHAACKRERERERDGKSLHHFGQTNKGKRPLGRFTRIWRDNIKAKYSKTGYVDVNWVHLAQVGSSTVQM